MLYVLLYRFHLEGRHKYHPVEWRAGVIWCRGNFPSSRRAVHKMQCWRSCISYTSPRTAGGVVLVRFFSLKLHWEEQQPLWWMPRITVLPLPVWKAYQGKQEKGSLTAAAAALVKETKAQRCVCGGGELDSSAFKYPPLCANALSSFCHLPCFTLFLSFHITDVPRCFHMLSTGITEMWGFPYLKANKLP